MMKLRSSAASPCVRKVRMVAEALGLTGRIALVPAYTADPSEPPRRQNPLGRVPTLILEDGRTLYDSRVIVEYLDGLTGGDKVVPATGFERFDALHPSRSPMASPTPRCSWSVNGAGANRRGAPRNGWAISAAR
jgi:glutathione S-transferase